MTYDEWKTKTPPQEKENQCGFCGEDADGEFCSKECEKAYLKDN